MCRPGPIQVVHGGTVHRQAVNRMTQKTFAALDWVGMGGQACRQRRSLEPETMRNRRSDDAGQTTLTFTSAWSCQRARCHSANYPTLFEITCRGPELANFLAVATLGHGTLITRDF